MPLIQFTGPVPAAPPGVPLFQPDEVRAVGEELADYLCRNAQFVRLDAAPNEPAPPAEPDPAPYPAPFIPDMEG